MSETDWSKLQRSHQRMPDFVQEALEREGLMAAFQGRPAYQQNDYVGWINRAKREATKQKRLGQMLAELEQGNVYMRMDWKPAKGS